MIYNDLRPMHFSDVVGQAAAKFLLNASRTGRLREYRAILLHGPAGVGKTTLARIIAHAVNCTDLDNGEPCGECPECKTVYESIDHGGDVSELDGASCGGIDSIRTIIESANYQPMTLDKKVFIIDECHQLSVAARDAMLKTLEDGPPYTMFVLCTTAPDRLSSTVVSRCIALPLTTPSEDDVITVLKRASDADNASLKRIAMASGGSIREALSILEKAVDYGDLGEALDLLTPGYNTVREAVNAVVKGDPSLAAKIDTAFVGRDPEGFMRSVIAEISKGVKRMAATTSRKTKDGVGIAELAEVCDFLAHSTVSYAQLGANANMLAIIGAAEIIRRKIDATKTQ